jgi:uncharacterized protein (TIGR02453 family)
VGIHFRHEFGKDVHAPGFYVHIAPDECFLAMGLWRPDAASLARIRRAIVDDPPKWKRARDNKKFRSHFDLTGESLKSVPRGFPKDHVMVDDLKRKDFIGVRDLAEEDILDDRFLDTAKSSFMASRAYMRFLCEALSLPF